MPYNYHKPGHPYIPETRVAQVPPAVIPLPNPDDFDTQVTLKRVALEQVTGPSTWQQFQDILSFVKNWLVIITCMAILYSLYEIHVFAIHLQQGLQQFANNFGG
jgi:hypothetical protein